MFIPCAKKRKRSSAYFELQYCKKEGDLKKLVENGYGYWEKDSLLVHIDHEEGFFNGYRKYLEPTNAPNGTCEFCYYGVNYYTKEQTESILERIKEDKPEGFEVISSWLEKAVNDYNDFYLLGI